MVTMAPAQPRGATRAEPLLPLAAVGFTVVAWASAFVALGTVWRGAAVLALVKPSLAPFALVGVGSRRWWVLFGLYAAIAVVMLPLWLDYLTVLRNGRGLDALYSIGHVPMLLIPLIAWWTRGRQSSPATGRRISLRRRSVWLPSWRPRDRPDGITGRLSRE